MGWLDHLMAQSWGAITRTMPCPALSEVYRRHRGFDWHHWGIMIPNMADPFGFADVVVSMGLPGFDFFTERSETLGSPQNTALLLVASGGFEALHASFDIQKTCTTVASPGEPVSLRMGDVLVLEGDHPRWTVRATMPDRSLNLEIACTEEATWFARFPGLYDHVGVAATYRGTVTVGGTEHIVSGPCSFEHAYGRSIARLPGEPRLPIRLFNYEVLSLDDGRQLLLARVGRAPNALWIKSAWLKGGGGSQQVFSHVEQRVETVEEAQTPDGRVMAVPMVWSTHLAGSAGEGTLKMRVDTALTYGLGRGFAAGYAFEGTLLGQAVSGRGYLEFVDVTS